MIAISLPHTQYALACYYIIASAEASSNLARYDGTRYGYRAKGYDNLIDMMVKSRSEGFGAEVKRRIMLGTFVLSSGYREAYYRKAAQVRRLLYDDFVKAFTLCDVLLNPISPTAAFKLGEKTSDPLQMYLSDIYSVSANLVGAPAITLPCGWTEDRLPVGVQLTAKWLDESTLFHAASVLEGLLADQNVSRNS
jgi:aspartyl-tRNA(Asn)/glutamyl-tRNA(Gln) amidotransferase subunit A